MIFIFQGTRPFTPELACRIQCNPAAGLEVIEQPCGAWDWRHNPLMVIGRDRMNNVVCCLVHGRYAKLYRRALVGIADIFAIPVRIIDVDELVVDHWPAAFGSWRRLLIAFLPALGEQFARQAIYEILHEKIISAREEPN